MITFEIDSSLHPCVCPICRWSGFTWAIVASRPSHQVRKVCPCCESYPRDRLLWKILSCIRSVSGRSNLRILEFGGAARAYWWKRRSYEYYNVDLKRNASDTVDGFIHHGRVDRRFEQIDVAVISYVFGEIRNVVTRSRIIAEAARATKEHGCLIIFDDLDLRLTKHRLLSRQQYFHKLRLGRPILEELRNGGWYPTVIEYLQANSMLGETELPFIVAFKSIDGFKETAFRDSNGF